MTELQPLTARVCFQVMLQAHKPVPHWQLWSRDFGRPGVSLFSQRPWFPRSERSCSSPQGTQDCSPQQPSPLPARVSGVPFPTQLWSDTHGGSWAVTAPPVRATDNTLSQGHGYQQCAATFNRVNMGKMQGLQSCWKTHPTAIVQLNKIKCLRKKNTQGFLQRAWQCAQQY